MANAPVGYTLIAESLMRMVQVVQVDPTMNCVDFDTAFSELVGSVIFIMGSCARAIS